MANGNGTFGNQVTGLIIAALLGAVVTGGGAWMVMSNNLARLEQGVHEHQTNPDIHMSFASKADTFVLRSEYEATMARIERSMDEIQKELRERD